MKNVKQVFLNLVDEFGLDFSECLSDMEHRTHFYAKLPGYAGFLIDSYWDNEECIRVATCYDKNENGPFFYGSEAFYDEHKVRNQVMTMIRNVKEKFIEGKIDKIETDFKCKLYFTSF